MLFFLIKMLQIFSLAVCILFISTVSAAQSLPCASALARRAVCTPANRRALEIMRARRLKAVTVVQDVRTGALVAFAASQPSEVNITTSIRPLSLSKLFLSASWWDNRQPNTTFDSTAGTSDATNPAYRSRISLHEMLVGGSDSAGRQAATVLRKSVGTKKVLEDFARYLLLRDDKFWGELDPLWKRSLTPAPASVSLTEETKDEEWADTLSLGESNLSVTALHISRFLQAVGNGGVQLIPIARDETKSGGQRTEFVNPIRIMDESTAVQLQSAMRDTVQRGTATSIARALSETGWQIGGKTGSGPALLPKGDLVDGWFAGLIFDPEGKPRFTVATFVRSGGKGGENAARISAELARYLLGAKNSQ
jgi:membrane peptidoglycan carboxypeptidase